MGPEAAEAVRDFLPEKGELVLRDPSDQHEVAVVMDAHDVQMMLDRAQSSALKKWVYELPDGTRGLTVDAVQDITQQMNWTGRARLGILPDTLEVERITEDLGNGPEPLWMATCFAEDAATGAKLPGTSMEPVYMVLTEKTARKWRERGKKVPDDRRVFDIYSRTKAINKAYRNALAAFIPEELEQTIIGMFANDPSRVEKIRTEAQAQVEEMPPPLDTPEAKALRERCDELYTEIKELGGGQGRVKFPPGQYAAWMLRSQHEIARLESFIEYLEQRLAEIPVEIKAEAEEREARDTVLDATCPLCGQGKSWRCAQLDKAGEKVLRDDKPVLMNAPHQERLVARLAEIRS